MRDIFGTDPTASTPAPRPTTRKRARDVCVYESDEQRIDAKLKLLPMAYPQKPSSMTTKEIRKTLRSLKVDTTGLLEATEYRACLEALMPDRCSICLETPKGPGEEKTPSDLYTFCPCGHAFHQLCLHEWATTQHKMRVGRGEGSTKPSCPLCVKPLFP